MSQEGNNLTAYKRGYNDGLCKRTRIARIEAAALAVLPAVWGSTGATDEKSVDCAIDIGRAFADAMEREEAGKP